MDTITIRKANALFWLGRYIERVYTTTYYYEKLFDVMLDQDKEIYHDYCKQLDIDDHYLNDAHFMMDYLYNTDNPDSIYSNLLRAYDNAIVLRDEIKTPVLSYIQMSINIFEMMETSDAPILLLQQVQDYLLAFWGALTEYSDLYHQTSKDIIKLGKFVERVDLYVRLSFEQDKLNQSLDKLSHRKRQMIKRIHVDGLDVDVSVETSRSELITKMNQISELFEVR